MNDLNVVAIMYLKASGLSLPMSMIFIQATAISGKADGAKLCNQSVFRSILGFQDRSFFGTNQGPMVCSLTNAPLAPASGLEQRLEKT